MTVAKLSPDQNQQHRQKVTIGRWLVLIPVVAVALTVLPACLAPMIVVPLLVALILPSGLQWQTIEPFAALGWAMGAVYEFSDFSNDYFAVSCLFLTAVPLALVWVIRAVSEPPWRRLKTRFDLALWLATPILGFIGLVCLVSDFDLRLRFALSETALRKALVEVRPGTDQFYGAKPRRFGLFEFRGYREVKGQVYWMVPTGYPSTELIYSPIGPPAPPTSEYRIRPLKGPWFVSEEYY